MTARAAHALARTGDVEKGNDRGEHGEDDDGDSHVAREPNRWVVDVCQPRVQ
jgi:hypothetical protein